MWSGDENELDSLESELCGERSSVRVQVSHSKKINLSHFAQNDADRAEKSAMRQARHTGRDDRATSEQVMDPRTRLILFKLLSRGTLESIDGCLSTGKEANVYFARRAAEDDECCSELAVKVYKTSILVFRDRERYVDGEHRFKNGYSKGKNPRKMVQLWAEKELRNYKRLASCGVRAPRPVILKGNVLVMEFIGDDGWPAPRLKDADLSESKLRAAYWQTLRAMRCMFKRCKLVHGDLSEYNMLWHRNEIVVIDVSQSVEMDHPRALEFLRVDCKNVNDFFSRHSVIKPLTIRSLFAFVTDENEPYETDAQVDESIQRALDAHLARTEAEDRENDDDAVFMSTHLPRSLHELGMTGYTCEREQDELRSGRREVAYETAVNSLLKDEKRSSSSDEAEDDEGSVLSAASPSSSHDEAEGEFYSDEEYEVIVSATGRLPSSPEHRALAKQKKKEATKAAKEAQAERRKTKLKKHLKKKAVKQQPQKKK